VRVHLKNKRKHQTCRFQGKEENRRRTWMAADVLFIL
jgi:hypothetical protein